MATGQSPIEVQELGDEVVEVFLNRGIMGTSISDQPLFVADRDYYLNQAWFRSGTTENDGETYVLNMVEDGVAIGDSSEVALTDAIEVHSSGGVWAANTKTDFTPTANNYIPAGAVIYATSSGTFQTTTPVLFGLRLVSRAH